MMSGHTCFCAEVVGASIVVLWAGKEVQAGDAESSKGRLSAGCRLDAAWANAGHAGLCDLTVHLCWARVLNMVCRKIQGMCRPSDMHY